MDALFGIPMQTIALVLLAAIFVVFGWFASMGWRARVLFRLGTRNVPRRPARAALIAFGLMLSTTVVASAFGTGDAMTWTVRSVITESLGTVDEIVVYNPSHAGRQERVKALTEPGLSSIAAANPDFFAQADAERLAGDVSASGAIRAVVPAILDQVAVVDPASQVAQASTLLLAIPPSNAADLGDADARLAELGPDDVLLNQAAASALGASAGGTLRLLTDESATPTPENAWQVTIAGIIKDGGVAGTQGAIIVPLARYQAITARAGDVNAALVVNTGGVQGVARTDDALLDLRVRLVDRATAEQLHDILGGVAAQRGLALAEGTLSGADRARLAEIRAEARRPETTDRFISLVSDPRVRSGLSYLARDALPRDQRVAVNQLLRDLTTLSVLPLKQQGIEQANEYGSVVTTVFLVLGIFSFAASVLLIFLMFSLLAAYRGAELATLRALGMRNRQVMGVFLVEGLIYDLAGAALGAVGGLGAAWLTIASISSTLAGFGFQVQRHVEPRSLFIAFALGLLLTFVAMLLAAWRVSRAQIVAATRGEALDEGRSWLAGVGAALLVAAWLVWRRWATPAFAFQPRHPLVTPATLSLVILGSACLLAPLAARTRRGGEALGTLAGLALIVVWLRTLAGLPTPSGATQADAITIAVAGLALLVATVWTAARALGPAMRALDRGLSACGRLRAVVRPASGQLGWQRWRTGLTVVMFGMVVFIMVAALTLIHVLLVAYGRNEAPVAGFEIRATVQQNQSIPDMRAALAQASGVSPGDFSAIGGVSVLDTQVVQFGTQRSAWRAATLAAADDGFLGAARVAFVRRAPGYASDAAVWQALRDQPGTAVISAALVSSGGALQLPEGGLQPTTLWARPDADNPTGTPIKLIVIGVIDPASELAAALYASRTTAAPLGALPTPQTYYFHLAPSVQVADAVTGLRVSFAAQGLVVSNLGDTLRVSQSVRSLLTRLVQGFMGLGLIAGIAALGMLGVQSVIERRRQLGTLRALGFTRWETRATLALESVVTAVLGVMVGVTLGLVLARSLVSLLAADNPEVIFSVPWSQIALTAGVAWLGSALAITLAAWQAGRVSPADALRVA